MDRNVDMFTIILNLYATNDTQGVFTIITLHEFQKSQYMLVFRRREQFARTTIRGPTSFLDEV